MKMNVGLSMFSVMGELMQDYMGTLENVAKAGYKYIEYIIPHSGEGLPTPEEIGAKVKELGLTAVSSHCNFTAEDDLEKIADDHVKMGAGAIVLPMTVMGNMDEVKKVADLCNRMGKICHERGMGFFYHNHCQEFLKIDGKYALLWLAELTNPEWVSFEVDTFWAKRGGVCPVELLKTLGSRCKLIHQKDMGESANPVNLMEGVTELSADSFREKIFGRTNPTDIVTVGTGTMDIQSIVDTAAELGFAPTIIVELDCICRFTEDHYETPLSPLESIRVSRENLEKMIG
ncbi:MAG: sugar phosphate isomerase/epimerase [Oscillospiraceae bacterium]|nr:sugar phosphate isomerase/epimerase [Oscillospiraceae bacterium]